MTDYALVLVTEYPGREWSLAGNDYGSLVIHDDGPKPTKKTLDDAWPQVKANLAWAEVRRQRDKLLAASDWTMMPDTPLSDPDRAAAAVYRQRLRDVPQDNADPHNITWPTVPWSAR